MKIPEYWRLKRDDKEIEIFIEFLSSEYGYIEKKRGGFMPSKVSYLGRKPTDTIIITVSQNKFLTSGIEHISKGEIDGKKILITWKEDYEKKIIDFDLKFIRKQKLEKINEKR